MFILNPGQQYVVDEAVKWFLTSKEQVFQFDGPPGSGKSVVLNEIITRLGLDDYTEIAPMSYIGSASLVMRMKGLLNARTAHSWLFDVKEVPLKDKNGRVIMDNLMNVPIKVPKFIPVDHLDPSIKLIVIDEGYTIPFSMKKDIEKFGVKILVAGDQGQLPPVNDKPAYLVDGKIYHLTQVMRQNGREDIVYIANRVLNGLPLINGYYGNSLVIDKNDLTNDMMLWADIIICGKNKTRDDINNHMRNLLGYRGDLPQYGEKIVCRKNNRLESVPFNTGAEVNLVNGLIGTVVSSPDVSSFSNNTFAINFKPDLVDVLFKNIRVNYKHMISDCKTREYIRNNRYEIGNMFEYAYAITSYIAQGGQWHNVVYIEESLHPTIQCQLNNVGASRADQRLIYVKNSNRFNIF